METKQIHRISLDDEKYKKLLGKDFEDFLPDTVPVERLFYEDVHIKKSAGTIHHASKRRGFEGKVITNTTFMKKSEIKKLNGKVHYSNMYADINNLPSIIVFSLLDQNEIIIELNGYLKYQSIQDIANKWDVDFDVVSDMIKKYQPEIPNERVVELFKYIGGMKSMSNENKIVSWKEFLIKSKEERKILFTTCYEEFGKKAMMNEWGSAQYYSMVRLLKLHDLVRDQTRRPSPIKVLEPVTVQAIEKMIQKVKNENKPKAPRNIVSSYVIDDVKMSADELIKRLMGLSQTVIEGKTYYATIIINEVAERLQKASEHLEPIEYEKGEES